MFLFPGFQSLQVPGFRHLVESTNKAALFPASLHLMFGQKVDPGLLRCDCTQEGVDQGADGPQGFEEELWQLVFSSAGDFCLAAHLHRAPVGSGGGAVRHCDPSDPSDPSDPRQAPLPEQVQNPEPGVRDPLVV